ncbi:MAG: arginine--tRNA ligase [Nitrospirae bacterium]|nr:arginine--tRNA ligase [Nitrospirota bacterium]
MKNEIISIITDAINKLGISQMPAIEVEVPPQETMGDIATPVAMSLAKLLKKSPGKIAEELVSYMSINDIFEKIEIAGPGFINFTFSKNYLISKLNEILQKPSVFLRKNIGHGRKVQIEFVSANPTGPLHLGHGRGAATGAALSNLLRAAGFNVIREYYINDAGRQVKLLGHSVFAKYREMQGIEYPFPEDGYKGLYVEDIAKEIFKKEGGKYLQSGFDEVADFFIDYSYKKILDDIKEDLKAFGIFFDVWQSERELFDSGDVDKALEYLKAKEYIYEKDGAVWFRSSFFGDEKDRVVIKQDGEYTYFTSDIAYHKKKIEKGYDELIDIWGADHHGYIPRVKAIIEAFGYPEDKLKVLLVQMVSLLRAGKPVQMSKRAGEFITLREVIDEVGADTTKFIFLTRRPDSHLEFDLEVAKMQSSENPVFYVQYAYARINSIFRNAVEKGIDINKTNYNLQFLNTPEEFRIIKKLLMYPMIFEGAVKTHEPHRITFYLQELAGLFHPYYNKYRVLANNNELTVARLLLCKAVKEILEEGLKILGISAPDRM